MTQLIKFDKPAEYYVEQVLQSIREGEQNPLDIWINKSKFDKIMKGISSNDDILDATLREFSKYNSKCIEYGGAKLEQCEVGVKYDYSNCGDPIIDELLKKQEEIAAKIKERQKTLINLPDSGLVDPESGAFIYPPSRSSKTTIKVTLKKK